MTVWNDIAKLEALLRDPAFEAITELGISHTLSVRDSRVWLSGHTSHDAFGVAPSKSGYVIGRSYFDLTGKMFFEEEGEVLKAPRDVAIAIITDWGKRVDPEDARGALGSLAAGDTPRIRSTPRPGVQGGKPTSGVE
jgi:hypothetical protein